MHLFLSLFYLRVSSGEDDAPPLALFAGSGRVQARAAQAVATAPRPFAIGHVVQSAIANTDVVIVRGRIIAQAPHGSWSVHGDVLVRRIVGRLERVGVLKVEHALGDVDIGEHHPSTAFVLVGGETDGVERLRLGHAAGQEPLVGALLVAQHKTTRKAPHGDHGTCGIVGIADRVGSASTKKTKSKHERNQRRTTKAIGV